MVSTTHLQPVANTYLFLTNVLSSVKIEKLVVPEIVATDCPDVVLSCEYSGAGDDVTMLVLHNGSKVYEWTRGSEPKVSGILDGRLDLTYRNTSPGVVERIVVLRIITLTPELSGDYTCVVRSHGHEARQTKTMTVFSPEQDFKIIFDSPLESDVVNIKCTARHLYPQPDLVIEYNKIPIAQQQRTWREGAYFEAVSAGALPRAGLRPGAELACRLHLPVVDYTAITTKHLHIDNRGSTFSSPSYFIIGLLLSIR